MFRKEPEGLHNAAEGSEEDEPGEEEGGVAGVEGRVQRGSHVGGGVGSGQEGEEGIFVRLGVVWVV